MENNNTSLEQLKDILHTSTLPDVLINRELECKQIRKFILDALKPNSGAVSRVLYISGVPGTGKTASVNKVVRDLHNQKTTAHFIFVVVNGLESSDSRYVFTKLYKSIAAQMGGAKRPLLRDTKNFLNNYFSDDYKGKRRPIIMLVDEVDMFYTKREELLYALFNWASLCGSRFSIIAISNTLDLAERNFSQRVISRMGTNKIIFQPYEFGEIEKIIKARIRSCPAISDKAIELAAKKVASVSGDLRKALELMRRAIDFALKDGGDHQTKKGSKSKTQLEIKHVQAAIKESIDSIRMEFIKGLPKHEELLFRALTAVLHEKGLEVTLFCQVLYHYKGLCNAEGIQPQTLSAAFHHLTNLADSHLVIMSSDGGQLHCKLQLGFPITEAKFCIRQLEI